MSSQRSWQGLDLRGYRCSGCLLLFVLLALPLSATIYYVDCNGADSNNGTSTSTPWQTIAKVNNSSFSPGDSVLFKAGCTWREQLTVPSSGSAGNVITFGAYGSGALPIISGADLLNSWTLSSGSIYYATETTSPRAVWQNNTQLSGPEANTGAMVAGSWFGDTGTNRLYVWTTDSSNPSTKTIESAKRSNGITLADISYVTIDSLQVEKTNDANKGAIWAYKSSGSPTNVTVQNSTVVYGMTGIMFQSVAYATAQNNTVHGNMYTDLSGIYVGADPGPACPNALIIGNNLHDVEFGTLQPIGVTSNTPNSRYAYNTVYNTINYGMHFNLSTPGLLIEGNIVHDGGGPTQDTHGIHWADSPGTEVRYNVVYNWLDNENWSGGGFQADNNSDNSVVHHNIAYNNGGCGFVVLNSSGVFVYNNSSYGNNTQRNFAEFCVLSPSGDGLDKASATIENNIGYATRSGTYAIYVDANSEAHTNTIGTNLWYRTSGNWWAHGGATSGSNLARATTGSNLSTWNAVSYVHSDLNADPKFNDASIADFTLRSSSPAIDAGINLGSTYQMGLAPLSSWPFGLGLDNQNSYGTGWEIGAFVFVKHIPPPPPTSLSATVE